MSFPAYPACPRLGRQGRFPPAKQSDYIGGAGKCNRGLPRATTSLGGLCTSARRSLLVLPVLYERFDRRAASLFRQWLPVRLRSEPDEDHAEEVDRAQDGPGRGEAVVKQGHQGGRLQGADRRE